jgi:hypothetical protein
MIDSLHVREFADGETIVQQGDEALEFFLIEEVEWLSEIKKQLEKRC